MNIAGVPLITLPDVVERLAEQMRLRGIEFVIIARGALPAELETMLTLLNTSIVELTAVDVDQWLGARGAEHVRVKHLELSDKKVIRSMRELYSHGRDAVGRQLSQARDSGHVDVSAMAEIAGAMLDLILRSDVPVTTMLALRGREDFALTHAMNVSMLASAQASALGLDEAMVRSISVAALTHDIGRASIPEAILHKTSRLTPTEMRMVQSHTIEGARILMRTQSVDGLEAIVAAEHHQPYTDGPHLASQIVAIADAFDGIRSLRPFSDRTSLRMALRFMLKKLRHRLNPYLLQRFCVLCGMYQLGDQVELTSGERGRVVALHPELGARPTIEVTDTATGSAPVGTVGDLSLSHMSHIAVRKDATLAFNDLSADDVDALG
jgi:putative nucleotidyltransferase with HDIG domain